MKNKTLHVLLYLAFFALNGCGSDRNETGASPSNTLPAANTPVEPPPAENPSSETRPPEEPPPGETAPGEVVALTLDPEIAAKGVAPNGSIVLISDRPLDAKTVETSLELRHAGTTETVPAVVSYEAEAQRIVIAPERILAEGQDYLVHVAGARDTDGNDIVVAGKKIVQTKQILYSRFTSYDDAGNIDAVIQYMPLPGKPGEGRKVWYDGPGDDADWATLDNNSVKEYTRILELSGGRKQELRYDGPGVDEIWFDDNDQFDRAYQTRRDSNGFVTESLQSVGAGDDGDLFTPDDIYVSANFWIYDDTGKLRVSAWMSGSQTYPVRPGDDLLWMTDDDPYLSSYHRYEYNADGRLEYDFYVNNEGTDGDWFTPDDVFRDFHRFEYNDAGERTKEFAIDDPGVNGQWFDDNDKGFFMYVMRWENGAKVKELFRSGGDGIPGTNDDYLQKYHYWTFDTQGRELTNGTFDRRGFDSSWHTPDDVFAKSGGWTSSYEFNAFGNMEWIKKHVVRDVDDQERFSGDEQIDTIVVRGYDDTSQLSYHRWYESVVPETGDGIIDGDYHLSFEYEYLAVEQSE